MMISNPIPGYDAWKLASPYDDERECEACGDVFVAREGRYCRACRDGHGPDPDAAYDRMRAERDARPGDADYWAPIDDGEDF
jgi:hypothetical protein